MRILTSFRAASAVRYFNGVIIHCLAVVIFFGCAAQNVPVTDVPLPPTSQLQAIEQEKQHEYLAALSYWQQARTEIDGRISTLSTVLEDISNSHSEKGVSLYEQRQGEDALSQFLTSLRYNPENETALRYLKENYTPLQFVPYSVKGEDTFESISQAVYGSPYDIFAVMHFSDFSEDGEHLPGTVINLPLLESFYSQALLDYQKDIIVARNLFKDEEYAELLPLAEKILASHPDDNEASYLVNSALIGLGEMLRDQEKYAEAVAMLSRVDPNFKNVKEPIQQIRKLQRQKLEKDTRRLNEELFEKGEMLFSEQKYIEALQIFREVDPQFEGVEKAIASVQEVMRMQADVHYKNGVKYFIDDNLAAAIEQWEKTLLFDPDHIKAMDYITKARGLLEKVKAID